MLWSPQAFGALVGLAALLIWVALMPSAAAQAVDARLERYRERLDIVEEEEMRRSFAARVLAPLVRKFLGALGRLAPTGNLARTQQLLIYAGEPLGMSALDFAGLRILAPVVFGGLAYLLLRRLPFNTMLPYLLMVVVLGYFLPFLWLRRRARQRQHEIARALPDALDMMTIGVEAGLGFESAMLKVGERWDNALSRELRRVVAEMRVGTPRDEALRRLAERTGVEGVRSFVTILIQSTQLGVSIAQVLHTQADQERLRRRQRAEELARQAGGKMVFPLIIFIFPALFVVILGPAVPGLLELMQTIRGSFSRAR
jgi:tight adherence protein C